MLDKKERELSLRASEVDKLEENIKEIDSQKKTRVGNNFKYEFGRS